jgi:hypothetical protein
MEVTSLADGAHAGAEAEIEGESFASWDPWYGGEVDGEIEAEGGAGDGKAKVTAEAKGSTTSGFSSDYSTCWLCANANGQVAGTSKGSVDLKNGEGGGAGFESMLGIGTAAIDTDGGMGSGNPDFAGSLSASATGTATLLEAFDNNYEWPYTEINSLSSVSGSASITAKQSGAGGIDVDASLYANPDIGYKPFEIDIPYGFDYDIMDREFGVLFDEEVDSFAKLDTEIEMGGGIGQGAGILEDGGFVGSATASASGTALTTVSMSEDFDYYYEWGSWWGDLASRASGKISSEASVDGNGAAYEESVIRSMASLGSGEDNSGGMFVEDSPIDFGWVTFAGTIGQLYTHEETYGAESEASSSVQGSATGTVNGGIDLYWYDYYSYGTEYIDFSSSSGASGKVSGEATSESIEGEADAAAAITGFNAVGPYLWYEDDLDGEGGEAGSQNFVEYGDLWWFATSQESIISAAAVLSPGEGDSSAKAEASGTANGAGTLDYENWYYNAYGWQDTVASRATGTGTFKSDVKATDGLGIAASFINGGNFAGWANYETQALIHSLDNKFWQAGIYAFTQGEGDSVKGTASATKAVSVESAAMTGSYWDSYDGDWDPEYSLSTYTYLADPAKAEISVKDWGWGLASTTASASSTALIDWPTGYQFSGVETAYSADAFGSPYGIVKASASIKPVNVHATSSTVHYFGGSTNAWILSSGSASASLKPAPSSSPDIYVPDASFSSNVIGGPIPFTIAYIGYSPDGDAAAGVGSFATDQYSP